MKIKQIQWVSGKSWQEKPGSDEVKNPQLVLFFTTLGKQEIEERCKDLKELFFKENDFNLVGCTSAGEIYDDDVYENTFSATAIEFDHATVEVSATQIGSEDQASFNAGKKVAEQLPTDGLKGALVISDGLKVNGSDLVKGIQSKLGTTIPLSGGLAGDQGRFSETFVYANGSAESGQLALIGLYGDLDIGHGSVGGWDEFGPVRTISESNGNVLEKIDGEFALDLYKKYLGDEHSQKLPGSALLFPILVYPEGKKDEGLVRTVLAVDEEKRTMTFAGDVPAGYCAQLMRANFDHIIDAAGEAASIAKIDSDERVSFALLISCVGRKMILGQRTADEVESVLEKLGKNTHQLGFYSYGEISPIVNIENSCALHNQTMTITTISEKKAS